MRVSAARASSRLASIWAGEGGDEGCKGAITGEDWSLASLGENGREVEWGAGSRPIGGDKNVVLKYGPFFCNPGSWRCSSH